MTLCPRDCIHAAHSLLTNDEYIFCGRLISAVIEKSSDIEQRNLASFFSVWKGLFQNESIRSSPKKKCGATSSGGTIFEGTRCNPNMFLGIGSSNGDTMGISFFAVSVTANSININVASCFSPPKVIPFFCCSIAASRPITPGSTSATKGGKSAKGNIGFTKHSFLFINYCFILSNFSRNMGIPIAYHG